MKKHMNIVYIIIVYIVMLVSTIIAFASTTGRIPWAFGIDGTPQHYGSRIILFIPIILLFGYTMIRIFFSIRTEDQHFYQLSPFILTIFLIINLGVLYINLYFSNGGTKLNFLLPVCSMLILAISIISIFMEKNNYIGVRTKWSLYNKETWKKTQIISAKTTSIIGSIIAFVTLVPAYPFNYILFAVGFVIDAILCYIYSFHYYKDEINKAN